MSAQSVAAAEAAYEAHIAQVVRLRAEGASEVEQAAARAKGRELAAAVDAAKSAPYVGQPATINLYSDTSAAVVVKVNAKSVVVRRVEVVEDSKRRINHEAEPFPAWAWDGDTEQPVGDPERYSLVGQREDGSPIYRNGSISLSLGRSVQVRDYRY